MSLLENKGLSNNVQDLNDILIGLLNLSDDMLFTLNNNGCFTSFNKRFSDFLTDYFGYQVEIGDALSQISAIPSLANLQIAVNKCLSGYNYTETFRITDGLGKVHYLDSIFNPIFNSQKQVSGLIFQAKLLSNEIKEDEFPDELSEKYYLAAEGAKAGNWEWNLKTKHAYFSPRYYTMLGYEPDEFEANEENWINLIHKDDLQLVQNTINEQIKTKSEYYEIEYRIRKKDGTYLWILGRGKAFFSDETGAPILMRGMNIDISKHKTDELLINELHAKYRLIFDTAGEVIFILEYNPGLINGVFFDANNAAVNALGYSIDEIKKLSLADVLFVEQTDQFEIEYLKNHDFLVTEKYLLTKSGNKIAFELSLNKVFFDGVPFLLVVGRNIEERKIKEGKLNDVVSQWQTTFDAVGDAICLIDENNVVRRCNKAMLELLNMSEEEALNKKCWEIFHSSNGPIIECPVEKSRFSLKTEERELPFKNRYFNVLAYPTSNDKGKYTGAIHILRDITDPKISEMQMLETEIRLKEAQRIAKMGDWEHDLIDDRIMASEELLLLLDIETKEEYVSFEDFLNVIHNDDLEIFKESYLNSLHEKIRFNFNYRIYDTNSKIKNINHISQTIFDDSGKPIKSFGALQDVTDKVKSDDLNKLNEARMKALLELAEMYGASEEEIIKFALEEGVIFTGSKIGYLHFVNADQVNLQLFVWSKEVYKKCKAEMAEKYPLNSAGIWADCVRFKIPVFHNDYHNIENKKGLPEGHIALNKHMSVPLIIADKIVAIAGVGNKEEDYNQNDAAQLTLFMQAMWTLIQKKRTDFELLKLSRAVDQSPVSIFITNPEGVIEYVNPKFCELTGYSINEIIGKRPNILKSGYTPAHIYIDLWATISSGKDWTGEILNKKKNGDLIWENLKISAIRNKNDEIIHYLAIKEDISQRKQIEKELISAKEKAESANKAKSDFLANMSHELRTPLHGIIGFSNILLDENGLTPEQIEYVEIIKSSSNNLFLLIQDMLEFSRIESGRLVSEIELVPVKELINLLFAEISTITEKKEIKLSYNISPDCEVIYSDKKRLNQILTNLLSNSAKYTKSGFIKVEVYKKDLIYFKVSDSGIGMAKESLDIIFEPFKQLEDPYVKKYQGIGLGLSIVKKLLDIAGGTIQVESELNIGTVFTVGLPIVYLDRVSNINKQSNMENIYNKLLSKLVLIVEDDIVNQKLIKTYLNKYGMNSEIAPTSQIAIEMAGKKAYDVILMDIGLPDKNGIDTAHEIRTFCDTPIIAITAHAYSQDKAKCLEIGMNDYLSKPVEELAVIECLMKYIP